MISSRYTLAFAAILAVGVGEKNMKNPRVKKPIATLAQRLKAIHKRPLSQQQIDRLNQVFDEMERTKNSEPEIKSPKKKIAHEPEAET